MPRRRLYQDTVEARPKRLKIIDQRAFSEAEIAMITALARYLSAGKGLPRDWYRTALFKNSDRLLKRRGYMHLHPGDMTSDVLLWVVQYDDAVALLTISDHGPF